MSIIMVTGLGGGGANKVAPPSRGNGPQNTALQRYPAPTLHAESIQNERKHLSKVIQWSMSLLALFGPYSMDKYLSWHLVIMEVPFFLASEPLPYTSIGSAALTL